MTIRVNEPLSSDHSQTGDSFSGTLMEPIIIVFLGTIIGGIVVSMYLPIFKLGQVV